MHRLGVSRVGLIVVLGIAIILTCLIFPAVLKIRESARRLATNNNLKQCAMAVHAYHDNFKILPNVYGPSPKHNKDISLWASLLPFIESWPVDRAEALLSEVPSYWAASDPFTTDWRGLVGFAGNVRVFGHQTLLANKQPVDELSRSVEIAAGRMISGLSLKDITDGGANTILMSTRYANCGGRKTWLAADIAGRCELGEFPSSGVGGFMGAGSSGMPASPNGDVSMIFQLAPTETGCLPQPGVFGHSFEIRGMSVALCDGAVYNIRADIEPRTFARALCPRWRPFEVD
ncbi:MAG: DUF1559 domain-containing protein [Planctomycetota bacterium]